MQQELQTGEYYLHSNGDLIYKPNGGVDQTSTFVKRLWSLAEIATSPDAFVGFLAEAYEAGANKERIVELANKSKLKIFHPNWRETVFGESS